jgi:hypothetical protein
MLSQRIEAIAGARQRDLVESRHIAIDKAPQRQSGLRMIQGSSSSLPTERQPATTLITTGWDEAIQNQRRSFRRSAGQQCACITHRELKACWNGMDGQQTIAQLLLSPLCSSRHGIETSLFHGGDGSFHQQLSKTRIAPWLGRCGGWNGT